MQTLRKPFLLYLIFLHLLVVLMLVKSDFLNRIGQRFGFIAPPELPEYYDRVSTYHTRMDPSIPAGATIFIGDSITQGLATSVADKSVNFGIGSDTTLGVVIRIKQYDSLRRAKALVLAIGINDFLWRDDEAILTNYKTILASIPETLPVVLSALLPIDEMTLEADHKNTRVVRVNEMLRAMAADYSNVTFLDIGSLLSGADGNLKSEFHVGDGIHLNAAGNEIWIGELRRVLDGVGDMGKVE